MNNTNVPENIAAVLRHMFAARSYVTETDEHGVNWHIDDHGLLYLDLWRAIVNHLAAKLPANYMERMHAYWGADINREGRLDVWRNDTDYITVELRAIYPDHVSFSAHQGLLSKTPAPAAMHLRGIDSLERIIRDYIETGSYTSDSYFANRRD